MSAGRPVDTVELHRWSVDHPAEFWAAAWEHPVPSVPLVGPSMAGEGMLGTTWFPDVRLNVAERILAGDSDPTRTPGPDDVMLVDETVEAPEAEVTTDAAPAAEEAAVEDAPAAGSDAEAPADAPSEADAADEAKA